MSDTQTNDGVVVTEEEVVIAPADAAEVAVEVVAEEVAAPAETEVVTEEVAAEAAPEVTA